MRLVSAGRGLSAAWLGLYRNPRSHGAPAGPRQTDSGGHREVTNIVDLMTHPESLVTVEELAAYWRVSERTIYRDIEKGAITVLRLPGGQFRIPITVAREYGKPNM